jgi:hypothetical protein
MSNLVLKAAHCLSLDAETNERLRAMLARIPKDLIYRLTVQQALTALGRGLANVKPSYYLTSPGGIGETQWIDIHREGVYKGRYTFTPKLNGTECRLNWFDGAETETERIIIMSLLDFHAKEMEREAAPQAGEVKVMGYDAVIGGSPGIDLRTGEETFTFKKTELIQKGIAAAASAAQLTPQPAQAASSANAAPQAVPSVETQGWDAVFDWYYSVGKPILRMTLKELAGSIGRSPGTVRNQKSLYDAEHNDNVVTTS